MKSTGIVRHLDNLGRLVIPVELRKTLQIGQKDAIEIFTDGERIVLQKHGACCSLCGSKEKSLKKYASQGRLCVDCINLIAERRQQILEQPDV
ncbi:hypothetical protein AZ66_06550 [Paenibacillus sp. E194]|uniref:AbrB/MazE/SpoVT family DNA-binding domain-containing protein n=1 Tax=Paenibacillus sp. E194 TaxID=1458845 RepID=UPI0005C8D42E|nr:AbrB/MazE/SpoVT family DNA-binding domain-containing protein [Paenibacillus sp. E194]KJB88605.1 hypothetical protein AZ66_06550 [Paenibacillus sp. E194]